MTTKEPYFWSAYLIPLPAPPAISRVRDGIMKTILAPIDFSPATKQVCKEAATLAKAVNGRIVLLHVVPPPVITSEYGALMENIGELTAATEAAAAKQLKRVAAQLQRQFVVIESLKFTGAPVQVILEQAEELAADYIVLGSHGHTALYELLVGSTAHGVLMKAKCPVMIVPPLRAAKKKTDRKAA
jgi:nucleotide-binding universal stress UspA family protein